MKKLFRLMLVLGVIAQSLVFAAPAALAIAPGNDAFERTWARTDQPVASGAVARTWMWGPDAFTHPLFEPYLESGSSGRVVQYFDKSRMEITHPDAGASDWYVTNGLLVVEMITGRIQVGNNVFIDVDNASINVAGDPDDPTGPTYATFADLLDRAPANVGAAYTGRLDRAGNVVLDEALAERGVTAATIDPVTNHAIAAPFWSFMHSSGLIWDDGMLVEAPLAPNPIYATGLPITEAYWTWVKVAGTYKDVLVQCFERRCLTYTPQNDPGWQVEAGNVGQHYQRWRYESGLVYAVKWITAAEGGSIALGGVSVNIPAGALSADTLVSIVPARHTPAPPAGYVAIGDAYSLSLAGATLAGPVSVTLPYHAALMPSGVAESDMVAGRYGEGAAQWSQLSGQVADGTITVETTEFSVWQAFAPGEPPIPDNTTPVANSQVVAVNEDSSVAITLAGSDADGDSLSFTIVTQPVNGTLSGTAPNLTYTPKADFFGPDLFTFRVNDGKAVSAIATVSITVKPINDAPVANGQSVQAVGSVARSIVLTGSDIDSISLTFQVTGGPSKGTLDTTTPAASCTPSGSGTTCTATVTYTANVGATGTDTFTFTVTDGSSAASSPATVSIAVVSASPTTSTIDAAPTSILADGVSTSTITVQLRNQSGTALTTSGGTVTLATTAGILSAITDNNDGTYTATLTAPTTVGSATITGTINGQAISDDALVTFASGTDTAPEVVSTSPADNGELASPGAAITINFSEPVNLSSDWFALVCDSDTRGPADALVSGTSDQRTITFNENLTSGESCEMTIVAAKVTDQDVDDPPDAMAQDYVFSFTVPVEAVNDSFAATGNIAISINAAGVLANDNPATGSSVAAVQGSDANVGVWTNTDTSGLDNVFGRVKLNADGSFEYDPPPGFTGNDTFTYTILKGTVESNTATVTISVSAVSGVLMWFVCGECTSDNHGTLLNPFTRVGNFSTANGSVSTHAPQANHIVYVQSGTYNHSSDRLALRNGQKAYGQALAASSVFTPNTNSVAAFAALTASGTRSTIAPSGGSEAVNLANGNTLQGFDVVSSALTSGIVGSSIGTLTINDLSISGAGTALNLSNGTLVASFTSVASSGGTHNISLTSVNSASAISLGSAAFSGASSHSIAINGGTISLTHSGTISKSSGTGAILHISNGHTGTVTFSGALTATAGTGLQFDNADGSYSLGSASNAFNGGDVGIDILNGSDGTFNISGNIGTSTSPSGSAFVVSNSAAKATFVGNITKSSSGGRAVDISALGSSGFVIISGTVTAANASTGVNLSNAAGPVSFTTLTLGTSAARFGSTPLTLSGNSGAVNLGNVSIFTSGAAALVSTSPAATPGLLSSTAGTIDASGGIAVNIAHGSIFQPLNLTLTTVSASGASNGIVLTRTTAQGTPGGFRVLGTGGACTVATPTCTGGTIQNTSGDAISLNNAASPSFTRMRIHNNLGSGVMASGVSGLSLIDSLVTSNADTTGGTEAGMLLFNLTGTTTITNTVIRDSREDNIRWTPNSGTATLNISGSTIGPNPVGSGNNGVNIIGTGTAVVTVNVTNSTFAGNQASGFGTSFADTAAHTVNISGSTFTDNNMAIALATAGDADLTFDIANNPTMLRSKTNAIQVLASGTTNGTIRGKIQGNTIGDGSADSGAGALHGIAVEFNQDVDAVISITGNVVRNTDQHGIFVHVRDESLSGPVAMVDVTVRGNTVHAPDDNSTFPVGFVYGVLIDVRHDTNTCLDLASNVSAGVGGAEHFRLRQRDSSTFRLERLTSGAVTNAVTVESHVVAENSYVGVTADATISTQFTGVANGTCRKP